MRRFVDTSRPDDQQLGRPMFSTSVSTAPEHDDAPNSPAPNDQLLLRGLTARVRSAFPDLQFTTAVVEERGGDHHILLLDKTYAFRFPRETMHDLDVEIAVLAALRKRCDVSVPEYRFVHPAGRFAGYPFIAGDELTPRRYAALTPTVQHRILDRAGRFLSALHGLIPEDVLPVGRWPVMATAADQIADARTRRLPQIVRIFPELAQSINAFYDACPDSPVKRQVVLHGDLVDDHILLTRDGSDLAGIIDFGDVALGDPAQDLSGFWVYGSDAVTRVIAAYELDADNDLHAQSRQAFIRYRIDRFAELLATDGSRAAEGSIAALMTLLSTSNPSAATGASQVS